MNKRSISIVMAVIFFGSIIVLWLLKLLSPTQDDSRKLQPVLVEVTTARKKNRVQTIEAIGTATAYESVTISANVTEYVRKLYFKDGDKVKKGDLLVEMTANEEKSRLDEAKARLLQARQQYGRIKDLLKRNFSAKSEYDSQKAALDSVTAQVAQIQSQLEDRSIRAPFNGILGFRQVSVGSLLEPGDAVVTLDMIQPLKIDFTIPEKRLDQVKPGQLFKVLSVAYPDKTFPGKIETINPRLDAASRSVLIRGVVDNKELKLKPGMLLKVELPIGERTLISIPEESLLASDKQRYVFVVVNGRAKKRKVTVFRRHRDKVEVTGNVVPGEQVVSQGAFKLRENQKVRIHHAH